MNKKLTDIVQQHKYYMSDLIFAILYYCQYTYYFIENVFAMCSPTP